MNKLIRLIATATTSAAVAGAALVGTAGAASAAPLPTSSEQRTTTVATTDRDSERHDRDSERYDRDVKRHDRDDRNDRWRWNDRWDRGHDGYWYWSDRDRHHYRYDGHRYFRWIEGKWIVIVLKDHRHDVHTWNLDRIADGQKHNSHKS